MIIGSFIRYFKTYQGINFIPITDCDSFCGLVGNNGIGKSSVLESLDCFFNDKQWNYNIATKKSGLSSTTPYIVPVFLVKKSDIGSSNTDEAKTLSDFVLSIVESEIPLSNRAHLKAFKELIEKLKQNINIDDYYILPLGDDYSGKINISIFNCTKFAKILSSTESRDSILSNEELLIFNSLRDKLKKSIEYIYIPREIDPEAFTKLETSEIQILMGETLNEILEARVTTAQINDINKSLNEFITTLASELGIYSYRTPTDRQKYLRKNDVYKLIIEAFFNIRKLHKKQGTHWLEIGDLSSGEKQKAIIDVAHKLLLHHREGGNNLIIAIDEPESSLHMSACFDQFDALYEISRSCRQVLFSSHWYGFFPTIEKGSVTVISKQKNDHVFDLINLSYYREQIKQMISGSRKKLPYDIRLKSINDFIQSVITSSIGETPYNWIICEGSSERIYLSSYLSDLIESKKLRIVPVGGAGEIKRIYNHLSASYDDFKDEITGKIILISDTDAELVRYSTRNHENLICKRIVNCLTKKTTRLVNIDSNPVSPKTEIEDSLNGKVFLETLNTFISDNSSLSFLNDISPESENSTYFSLDLKTK